MDAHLTVVHLLPDLMNLYGDGGNVLALRRRCEWRGIGVEVVRVPAGETPTLADCDVLFMGGGQDRDQMRAARELDRYGSAVRGYVADGGVALAICGGFQLFGTEYVTPGGRRAGGIGVFDAVTSAPGGPRLVGDLVVDPACGGATDPAEAWLRSSSRPLVGFENHAGVTELRGDTRPLGRVLAGHGNGAGAGIEGAVVRHAIGTYLHGALLPRNPWLADRMIAIALERRMGRTVNLAPLDDALETGAHAAALRRCAPAA